MRKQISFTGENGTFHGLVNIEFLENSFELSSYVSDVLQRNQKCTTAQEVLIIQGQMVADTQIKIEKLATNEKALEEKLIDLGYN